MAATARKSRVGRNKLTLLRVFGRTIPPVTFIVARNDNVSGMFSQSFWRLEQIASLQAQKESSLEGRACERINPEYYFRVTTAILWRRYMLYRFRWVRESVRSADARMSYARIAGAFWSGPSCCRFSCGR